MAIESVHLFLIFRNKGWEQVSVWSIWSTSLKSQESVNYFRMKKEVVTKADDTGSKPVKRHGLWARSERRKVNIYVFFFQNLNEKTPQSQRSLHIFLNKINSHITFNFISITKKGLMISNSIWRLFLNTFPLHFLTKQLVKLVLRQLTLIKSKTILSSNTWIQGTIKC